MKKSTLLGAFPLGLALLGTYSASAQQSIGAGATAPRPGTMLDVNGPLAFYETSVAASGNAATVSGNVGAVQLTTGSATASPIVVSYANTPVAGQHLTIYNNAAFAATFNGLDIPTGQAVGFVYSNGGWRAVGAAGNGIAATNGLTKTSNSIALGGALTQATTTISNITTANTLGFTGTDAASFTNTTAASTAGNKALTLAAPAAAGTAGSGPYLSFNTNTTETGRVANATEGTNLTGLSFNTFGITPSISGSTAALTERLRISGRGYVGIGTANPISLLHMVQPGSASAIATSFLSPGQIITGPSSNAGFSGPGLYLEALNNPTNQRVFKVNATTNLPGTTGLLNIQSVSNDASVANSNSLLAVLADGRIGIGGTTNPGGLVHMVQPGSLSNITTSFLTPGHLITGPSGDLSTGLSGPGLYLEALNNPVNQKVMKINMSKNGNAANSVGFLNFQSVSDNAGASNANVLSVLTDGRIGIGGVTNPGALVHIVQPGITSNITTSFLTPGQIISGTGGSSADGYSGPGLYFEAVNNPVNQKVMKVNMSTDPNGQGFLNFQSVTDNAGATVNSVMALQSDGQVGIGQLAPAYKLDVNGQIRATSNMLATAFTVTSDRRLKRNIAPSAYGLSTVMQLQPVQYEKKETLASTSYGRHEIGFIAQEVQKVLPSLVVEGKDTDKTLAISYTELIPVLTKALQEQEAKIEALEKANSKLAADNNALKASLDGKASASTLSDLQAALTSLQAEVQHLRASGASASTK